MQLLDVSRAEATCRCYRTLVHTILFHPGRQPAKFGLSTITALGTVFDLQGYCQYHRTLTLSNRRYTPRRSPQRSCSTL